MTYKENELPQVVKHLISEANSKTLCFYGEMGAGKTTLIKALVKELGSADTVSSPTFGLVNEYHKVDDSVLGFHFDFYRLNDENEAYDIGFEDYLNQDCWIFIEWPENIPSLVPQNITKVSINILNETTREIEIENLN